MDVIEVRMRCLELAAARGGWEPETIIEATKSLEQFVNAAAVAPPPENGNNTGSDNGTPTT